MKYSIAIDGPAASGKSTTANKVAKKLGFEWINSGLIYRTITYILNKDTPGFEITDPKTVKKVNEIEIKIQNARIIYNNEDISNFLHTGKIDKLVGTVAKELYVREKAHKIQHEALDQIQTGVVMDGRDIGTVVLPNAFLKVFINASPLTRAKRRQKEESSDNLNEILNDIIKRDECDIKRTHGPLKCADNALVINNDNMSLDQVVDMIVEEFKKKDKLINKK